MKELVEVITSNDVTHVLLNRPEKKNALSLEMMNRLIEALPRDARVVVLEAKGDFFCSGMDLDDVKKYGKECAHKMGEVFMALTSLSCVTIAKVRGGAFAGGLGLVAACDLAYAEEDAVFCLPELQKGLVPAFVTSLLKGQCHPRFLHEMILTGERITAAKAESMGLINHAVKDLDLAVSETIEKVLKSDPNATKLFKKSFMQRDLRELFEKANSLHAQVMEERRGN